MEKVINDFSVGLFLWQIVVLLISVVAIVFLYKLAKRIWKFYEKG
ncbi:hypothetical protein [Flavobacterium sp.]|nr:hypothetical protein [Flavobacterium sp.]